MEMKRTIKILFIIFVELFFLWSVFSCIYYASPWRSNNYINYLPEHRICPQYDLKTGEVTNRAEVTFWSANDYVPPINMVVENIFNCFTKYWLVFLSVLLLLFPLVYYYTGRKKNNILLLVTYYQLLLIAIMVLALI